MEKPLFLQGASAMDERTHTRIKDIAERAACSIGTVDRVIHKRGKVSEEVRKRVLQAMQELDYMPNVNARVLARKDPLVLGILGTAGTGDHTGD
jgi:LacI family transcriptional regulator